MIITYIAGKGTDLYIVIEHTDTANGGLYSVLCYAGIMIIILLYIILFAV